MKRILIVAGAVILAVIVAVFAIRTIRSLRTAVLGSGGPMTVNDYPTAIGTVAVPLTLTSSYTAGGSASSTALLNEGLPNTVISGTYTPKSYGSVLYLLVSRSVDGGSTYKPYSVLSPEAGDVLVYTNGTSTTTGIPFVIPGTGIGTAASGTAITFSYDLTMAGDYLKVAAKEYTTSTYGTANVQVQVSSN
jgi:hypothetical protein